MHDVDLVAGPQPHRDLLRATPSLGSTSSVVNVTCHRSPAGDHRVVGATTYGDAPPAITPSYSGFVNGDSASVLTARPDLLDHRDLVQLGRQLPDLLLGRSGRQLLDHLRRR